ncbi:MAG: hypothetical protein U5L96_15795 [Owenweeksia sp.]|nr:hypothetical protein [Owenweeksia sp.]
MWLSDGNSLDDFFALAGCTPISSGPHSISRRMHYNARHIREVLESHGQSRWYHVDKWWDNFPVITVVFLLSLVTIPWFKKANRKLLISLLISIIAVLLFFTLAQTKLMGYTVILLPLVAFCMAAGLEQLRSKIRYISLGIILLFTGKFMVEDYLQKEQYSDGYVFMPKQIRSFCHGPLRPRLPG